MDLRYFPFDTQQCQLKFGSWVYDGFKLDLDFFEGHEGLDLNDYINSVQWDIVDNVARKNVKYYSCCHEPYPDITFSLTFKRRANIYGNTLLVSSTCMLSLLILFNFFLPPDSRNRLVLGELCFSSFYKFFRRFASLNGLHRSFCCPIICIMYQYLTSYFHV